MYSFSFNRSVVFLTSYFGLRLRYQAENLKVQVLKVYENENSYDVRSVHSRGVPRRRIPEGSLKDNASGFSVLGSLEAFGSRMKGKRCTDRKEIRSLKTTVAEMRNKIAELKSEKRVVLKKTDCLKKELECNNEMLRNLRPCRIFDRRSESNEVTKRRGSKEVKRRREGNEVVDSIRDHVNIMIAIKEDEVKKLLIQLDQLNEKFLSQRNDLRECKNRLQWIE